MPIQVVDFTATNAPAAFSASLRNTGFAVLSHHPISHALIEKMYAQWNTFFYSKEKWYFEFDPNTHDGFISKTLSETAKGYGKKDIKEFFHFYPWGRCPESCRETTLQLSTALTDMASTLLRWIEENSPSDVRARYSMPLPEMIKNCRRTLFRIIHYPPLTGDEPTGAMRAAAHGDINMLTLLPAATAAGLQVKAMNGEWLDVPINPGWIIVNIGDMLAEASGNYYPSTLHRVINPIGEIAKQARLSMPLFLHARGEVKLSDRYTVENYLLERYAELGLAK